MLETLNRVHTEQLVLPAWGGTLSFTQHTLKMTVSTESLKIIKMMGEEFVLPCFVLFQMKVCVVCGPRAQHEFLVPRFPHSPRWLLDLRVPHG